ncbi:MAG: hypothetical protein A3F78_10480 [Burkholderiales bacterium RIFCSPLOWO2_12_FULL_61_40]|nr:MAG: hypothetical protein A3F78_10480 [Burkholderiales bacterium RIFCSPLOWO2_12_FULL_61_40]
MGYYGWKPYVPVAERRKKAEKTAAKAKKAGANFSPIAPYRGAVAKTFWGKAWCDNLEAYSDYANRMPRGRTYVRNGSVIDLQVTAGEVQAQVMGSSLYQVVVKVVPVSPKQWQAIGKDCAGSIDSLVELLQGKLSTAVMQRICTPRTGLFPAPQEISFSCSCPDWAGMCKHVAAVLYGVGARLDQKPELLFELRGVDAKDLVHQAGAGLPQSKKGPAVAKVLDDSLLADVFGIEMDEAVLPVKAPSASKKAAPAKKTAPRKAASTKAAPTKTVAPKPASKKAVKAPKAAASKTSGAKTKPALKPAAKKKVVKTVPAGK